MYHSMGVLLVKVGWRAGYVVDRPFQHDCSRVCIACFMSLAGCWPFFFGGGGGILGKRRSS